MWVCGERQSWWHDYLMRVRCATKSHDKTGEAWGTFHKIGFWDFDFHLRMMPVYDVTYFRRISHLSNIQIHIPAVERAGRNASH